jgi:hypothetical protein
MSQPAALVFADANATEFDAHVGPRVKGYLRKWMMPERPKLGMNRPE